MKKEKILCLATSLLLLAACGNGGESSSPVTSNSESSSSTSSETSTAESSSSTSSEEYSSSSSGSKTIYTIDYEEEKANFVTEAFSIEIDPETAAEGDTSENTISYDAANKTYTLSPTSDKTEYTLKGYFDGKIVNTVKGTVLNLNGAYLENTSGDYPVYSSLKIEVSAKADSENYIVSHLVEGQSCNAALYSEKAIEIGGKGSLAIVGNTKGGHGVKGDTVRLKGSGLFAFQGDSDGSAINCNDFEIEKKTDDDIKTFKAFMVNSKNGIKADKSITIPSGNFYFVSDKTGMKTDEGGSISIDDAANIYMEDVKTYFAGATTDYVIKSNN